jgi:tetratricopeptide (TPR) repeat protein
MVLGDALQRHRFSPVREAADYARLSQALIRQNKATQALAPLVQAKREFRDESSSLLLGAHEVIALRGSGERAKAEALMGSLIERARHVLPGDTAMALAEACYLTGHEQAGEQILAHAVQNAPEDTRVHGQARAVLRAAGKSDQHSDALIETNQRQVILLNNEGVAKAERGELEAAISLLSNAADRLPNNILIVSNAALVIAKQMLTRGQDNELLRACLRYRGAVAQQSPEHPKLQQIDVLLSRLRKSESV